jgi:hypothetical protein
MTNKLQGATNLAKRGWCALQDSNLRPPGS